MTLHILLSSCEQEGVSLRWDGKTITACGAESAVVRMLPLLKENKLELCALLQTAARESFEKRAAIMEFDGGLSRKNAEKYLTKKH